MELGRGIQSSPPMSSVVCSHGVKSDVFFTSGNKAARGNSWIIGDCRIEHSGDITRGNAGAGESLSPRCSVRTNGRWKVLDGLDHFSEWRHVLVHSSGDS